MRGLRTSAFVGCAAAVLVVAVVSGQRGGMDADRKIPGGGITAAGWTGKIDPPSEKAGYTIKDSKFEEKGGTFTLQVGPAASYWNPANTASGDYTVKATFTEGKMMSGHPHPMGLIIGGTKMGTADQSYIYCTAYRDGSFIVGRFNGDTPTRVVRKTPNAAIHKAASEDESVTQEVAWVVKGPRVECMVNGTVVQGFDKSEIVGPGKLESTDGVYGIRVSHNMDLTVKDLKVTKP
jgi:hypothetical protein